MWICCCTAVKVKGNASFFAKMLLYRRGTFVAQLLLLAPQLDTDRIQLKPPGAPGHACHSGPFCWAQVSRNELPDFRQEISRDLVLIFCPARAFAAFC